MLVNVVTSTFPADQADAVAGILARFAVLSRLETWADAAALAHKCTPLTA